MPSVLLLPTPSQPLLLPGRPAGNQLAAWRYATLGRYRVEARRQGRQQAFERPR